MVNPLFKENVAAFNYAYYGKDGSRSELWSNSLVFDSIFVDELPIAGFNLPDYFSDDETWSLLEFKLREFPSYWKNQYESHLNNMKDQFSLFHPFLFLKRYADETEVITFFLSRSEPFMLNYYFNHIDKFRYFIKYFKAAGARLIYQALNHPTVFSSKLLISKKYASLPFKQINLSPLSKREQQIGCLLAQGQNVNQIAKNMQLSARTVETFISQLKNKLGCQSRSEVTQTFVAINGL